MKIMLDPMPQKRAMSADTITQWMAASESALNMKERVWIDKRAIASGVLEGQDAPEEFEAEAALRNLGVKEFAQLVMSKGDKSDAFRARELQRQGYMLRIEQATSLEELSAIELDVRTNYGR